MDDRHTAPARQLCGLLLLLVVSVSVRGGEHTLYQYGPDVGDSEVDATGSRETAVQLPTPLQYYGQTFQTAYILKDGMVALEPGTRYVEVRWREGIPNPAYDLPFIAPFHYDPFLALINPGLYAGKIYYKLISRSPSGSPQNDEDAQFLNYLDSYLANATVVLKEGFTSTFALRVTWENVTSSSACSNDALQGDGCSSNTFQVVIVADQTRTFAIFNYYKMEIPFTDHQLAGVNGGHGRGWTDVVPCTGSCAKRSKGDKDRIASLVQRVGSDMEGRYILVVDSDVIVRGGCLAPGLKNVPLEVYPRQAGMYGGEMLSVSGDCLPAGDAIFCRFGGTETTEGVMETSMRGRCPVPMLTTRGVVKVELSADNIAWKHSTFITIILPDMLPPALQMTDIIDPWLSTNPQELRVRWDSTLLSTNPRATVDIYLTGYKEDAYSEDTLIYRNILDLGADVPNSDRQYVIDPAQFTCTDNCEEFEVVLLRVRLADPYVDETTQRQWLAVGLLPMGWYIRDRMTQLYGQQWPEAKCRAWDQRDRLSATWLQQLIPCPCTLSQALADWGRWQPDGGCSMYAGSTCRYHQGAIHCIRSVHPSRDGAGNQCCYGPDGNLRYGADTYQGSTPDRSHYMGAAPFGRPDLVPSNSHWVQDVVTFYYCCLWATDQTQCQTYMDRRATRDCQAYVPPHAATVYGDPHIETFDGRSYFFGGSGDFWVLKSDELNIQGRFEERQNEYLQLQANQLAPTNLTSVAMWISGSDVVTVRLALLGGPSNRKLDIMVDSQRRFFEDASLMFQEFKDVSIVNNAMTASSSEDQQHSNFTVLFTSGAGVQVAERQGLLHVVVILPPETARTQGLLGTLDGDVSNDLTTPQGTVINFNQGESAIYNDFALTWGVSTDESRFHWPKAVNTAKSPLFGDPSTFPYRTDQQAHQPTTSQVSTVCGSSEVCRRDYYVTGDENVARASRYTEERFRALQAAHVTVRSCGLLDIPMAVKQPAVYLEGSQVTVTGCRPDNTQVVTSGPLVYTCSSADSSSAPVWSPQPDRDLCPHVAESAPQQASDVGMIVGIVVAVVVVIVVVVIVVVVCVRRRGDSSLESNDRPVPAKRSRVPADVVKDPETADSLLKDKEERREVRMSEVRAKAEEQV